MISLAFPAVLAEVLLIFEEQWQQKLQYKRKAHFNYIITSTLYMYMKQKQDPFGI